MIVWHFDWSKLKDKDTISAIAAAAGLIGTGVPALAKAVESFSLRSRRKQELERIEDLTELMKKIKSEDVLTESTLADVGAQIEAEIKTALAGLDKNRQNRQRVLQKKKERDLTFLGFTFLLFRPHGLGAWMAHFFAYLSALFAVFGLLIAAADKDDRAFLLGFVIFFLFLWLLFRMWALRARSRWRTARPAPSPASVGAGAASSQGHP